MELFPYIFTGMMFFCISIAVYNTMLEDATEDAIQRVFDQIKQLRNTKSSETKCNECA